MIAPDGRIGDVPNASVGDAVRNGFKVGQELIASDGRRGVVPLDKVHDALATGGFQLAPPPMPAPPNAILNDDAKRQRYSDIIGPNGGPGAPGEYEASIDPDTITGNYKGAAKAAASAVLNLPDVATLGVGPKLAKAVAPQSSKDTQAKVNAALQPKDDAEAAGSQVFNDATTAAGAASFVSGLPELFESIAGILRGKNAVNLPELLKNGPSQADAGEAAQAAAARVKQEAGAAVGTAKAAAIPDNFSLKLGDAKNLNSTLADITKNIGAESGGLESLRDPQLDIVRNVASELSDPDKTFNAQQLAAVRDQLNSQITRADAAARNGSATGDVSRLLKQIKSALDSDMYSAVSETSGPAAAGELQSAAKDYADVVNNQTRGPAKSLFQAKTPEAAIRKLSYPSTDATVVSSYLKDFKPDEVQTVRDGVFKDMLERSTSNGATDWADALKRFERRGDAAKALFGSDYDSYHDALATAVKAARRGQLVTKAGKLVLGGALSGTAAGAGFKVIRDFLGAE